VAILHDAAMHVTAEVVALELARTFTIARGASEVEEVLVVRLERDGLVGLGEGAPVDYADEDLASALRFAAEEAPALLADDAAAPETLLARLAAVDAPRAVRTAVDGALHDLLGKRLGVPVHVLLGLERLGPPTSFTLGIDTLEGTHERVREAVGFRALKLKVGGPGDLERLRLVAAETPARLRVDGNEGWTLETALEAMPTLVELGVELLEQPFPTYDADAYHALRAHHPRVPVVLDEACDDSRSVPHCAALAEGVNVKLAKTGGIREALRAIHAARAHGLRVMLGCMIESELGIAQAAQLASLADWVDLDGHLLLRRSPFTGLGLEEGRVAPSATAPGLGVEETEAGAAGRGAEEPGT